MKRFSLFLTAIITLALSGTAMAEIFAFIQMPLTPSQEATATATAPASDGYGTVTALYDDATKILTYNVVWQLNEGSTVSNNHLHGPAGVGTAAGVAVSLPTLPATNSGRFGGTATLSDTQETDLLAGNMYFNIHSTLAPGGELRGQMIQNPTSGNLVFQNNAISIKNLIAPGFDGSQVYDIDLTVNTNTSSLDVSTATPQR